MKRMWTLEELVELIRENGFDPSSIESGTIAASSIVGINADGEFVKGNLYGQYVRIIKASDITSPLTPEVKAAIMEGTFIEGIFGEPYHYHKNPLLFPPSIWIDTYYGIGLGIKCTEDGSTGPYTDFEFFKYRITPQDTLYYNDNPVIIIGQTAGASNRLIGTFDITVGLLNGKNFPNYPADADTKTYALQLVNGTLTWVDITPAP